MTDLRIGSLCTGYGGLDMAVMDVLGGSMAWHCQYDPEDKHQYAAQILEHHWPNVPNHGDITAVDWAEVEPVDVLTAGFPCQDLSYAGRGAGIKEGTRSGLWYSVADAIGALRPGLVVLENVRAIVARRPGLDAVVASLTGLGYDAEWTCVRASDVGAPHIRERWFCLAWPADAAGSGLEGAWLRRRLAERGGVAADSDDQREHGRGRFGGQPQRHAPSADRDAADSTSLRAGEPADEALPDPESREARAVPGRRDERAESGFVPSVARGVAPNAAGDGRDERRPEPAGQLGRPDAAIGGGSTAADSDGGRFAGHTERHGTSQGGAEADHEHRVDADGRVLDWRQYGPAVVRWEHILGRPAPSPVDDRGRLAAPFVEWMMGLPEGHVCDVPAPDGMTVAGLRNARLKALGNGVVRQQAAYALRLLLDRLASEVAA